MVSSITSQLSGRRGPVAAFSRPTAAGFTLIELLVVIGIIVLLLGIALTVGRSVTNTGRMRATENILRTLDSGLSSDITERGGPPGLFHYGVSGTPTGPGPAYAFPIIDGRAERRQLGGDARFDVAGDPPQPSLTLLLLQSGEDSSLWGAVQSLDSRFVTERTDLPVYGWRALRDQNTGQWQASGSIQATPISGIVVNDAFGFPIRAVLPGVGGGSGPYYNPESGQVVQRDAHRLAPPAAGGSRPQEAEFVRSYRGFDPASARSQRPVGDADEGHPSGSRPYFYSSGPRGDPGLRNDNVYVTMPTFESETRNFPRPLN